MLDIVSTFLGIHTPVNMLFLLGFMLLLVVVFSLTVAVSKQEEEIKKLAQELALLKKDCLRENC